MSGLLGQILGGVLGGGQQGQQSNVAGILQQVLSMRDSNGNSGIAAIVAKFQSAGMGPQIQSWIGTGANAPVSANNISQAFSQEQLQGWAAQAGTTPEAISQVLAQALPHVVDHLTPTGEVPAQTPDLAGMLAKMLGGQTATRQA